MHSVSWYTVFRTKVLEAHHYDTYGDDHTSTSSEDEPPPTNTGGTTPVTMVTTPIGTELEESTHRAIAVLKQHKEFMHRQQVLAEQYRKEREALLPRGVSSKKAVLDCSEGEGEGSHSQQGREPQTERNRKRKLKKRKAKEKRVKINTS